MALPPAHPRLSARLNTVLSFRIDECRSLRLYEEADAEELYDVVVANRAHLARWMPWAAEQTLEDSREFIRTSRRQLAENQGFQLAITVEGQIVGGLGFHRLDWQSRSTSIGYWIAEAAQGHGTVTEAVRALVNHAFGTCKLNRVEIRAGVENLRSRAIPERLGFVEKGVLRRAELVGDRFIDHVVYAMLAQDWPADSG
jgi:ribosomal-protein-serine acetyltransferase